MRAVALNRDTVSGTTIRHRKYTMIYQDVVNEKDHNMVHTNAKNVLSTIAKSLTAMQNHAYMKVPTMNVSNAFDLPTMIKINVIIIMSSNSGKEKEMAEDI